MILRSLIFVHRWLGVALCVLFLLWFPSGIGMMYWGFPGVSATDRLDHSPNLDPSKIMLSPTEAAEKIGVQANPAQMRLNTFDGRPVYRLTGGGGRGRGGGGEGGGEGSGRRGGGGRIVYADTGEEQAEVNSAMLDRIASAWAAKPFAEAKKESVETVDQWTVAGNLKTLRPMFKYTWPDGQQVYLNGTTGEVVQYTTFWSRVAAHVSAIPHWLYYTPLRQNQPVWINLMIYGSLIGTIGAILGMVVAIWMYSPKQRYRLNGKPTGIPYRGQKRWHWILGMVFGIATVTWTFSGLLSLGPFPLVQRLTGTGPRQPQEQLQQPQQATPPQQVAAQATSPAEPTLQVAQANGEQQAGQPGEGRRRDGRGGRGRERGGRGGGLPRREQGGAPSREGQSEAAQARGESNSPQAAAAVSNRGRSNGGGQNQSAGRQGGAGGGRGGGQPGLAGALRGRARMADFADVHPRDLLAKVANLGVKELEFTSAMGAPLFNVNLAGGKSQLLALDGTPVNGFDQQKIIDIVKATALNPAMVETKVIDQYDFYYLDRTRQRPLPVILALMNDEDKTRYYIDPKTARVVTTYSSRNWVNRWLYNGLHSLNFPWLYNYRPLWDIIVIAFMVGGTALCVTSLVLTWRVLGRKLKRVAASDVLVAESAKS